MSTESYVLNTTNYDLFQTDIAVRSRCGDVQLTEVFNATDLLCGKLKQANFTYNLNIFCFCLVQARYVLCEVVQHLLDKFPLVSVSSFSYVLDNDKFEGEEEHMSFYLQRVGNSNVYMNPATPFGMIVNELEDFQNYFDCCLSFCAIYQQKSQSEDILICMRFNVLDGSRMSETNFVIAQTMCLTKQIQKIVQRFCCFDYEELNRYRTFLETGRFDNQDQEDYEFLTRSYAGTARYRKLLSGTQTTYSMPNEDHAMWLKEAVVRNRSIYVQYIYSDDASEQTALRKLSAIRQTKFNYAEPAECKIYHYGRLNNVQLQPDLEYFLLLRANQVNQINPLYSRKVFEVYELSELIAELGGFRRQTVIEPELEQYCKQIIDEYTHETLAKEEDDLISSKMLYSYATTDMQTVEQKQKQIARLTQRNKYLIKQMYQRLLNSQELLNTAKEAEEAQRASIVDYILSIFNKQGQKSQLVQSAFSIEDLQTTIPASTASRVQVYETQSAKEYQIQSRLEQLFINQQQLAIEYEKELGQLAYINQRLDSDKFYSSTEYVLEGCAFFTEQTGHDSFKRDTIKYLDKAKTERLRKSVENYRKNGLVLQQKVQEVYDLTKTVIDGKKRLYQKIQDAKQTREQHVSNIQKIAEYNLDLGLLQIKQKLSSLRTLQKSFQLTENMSQNQKQFTYRMREIENSLIDLQAGGIMLNDELNTKLYNVLDGGGKQFVEQFQDFGWRRLGKIADYFE